MMRRTTTTDFRDLLVSMPNESFLAPFATAHSKP